jgi:hypothetical protein
VQILIEQRPAAERPRGSRRYYLGRIFFVLPWLALAGCGEPSVRELKNRRELEALLTAISLKNKKELDKDIKRIDDRRASGELSDHGYSDLREIIKKAEAGEWRAAEKQAYELRESKPFFK